MAKGLRTGEVPGQEHTEVKPIEKIPIGKVVRAPKSNYQRRKESLAGLDTRADILENTLQPGVFDDKYLGYKGTYSYDTTAADLENAMYEDSSAIGNYAKAVGQLGAKTAVQIAGNIVGGIYGTGSALANWDFSKIYDNEVMDIVDATDKAISDSLYIYKPKGYDEAGFFEKLATPTVFAQDFADMMAFSLGAIGSVLITKGLGVTSAFSKLGNMGAKLLGKGFKASVQATRNATKGLAGAEKMNKAAQMAAGQAASQSKWRMAKNFANNALIGSTWESAIETKHAMEELKGYYKELGYDDAYIENMVTGAEKMVYAGNVAALTISNTMQFPRLFGSPAIRKIARSASSAKAAAKKVASGNKVGSLYNVSKAGGKVTASMAPKWKQGLLMAGHLVKNPLVEGSQEVAQGVISQGAVNAYGKEYDGDEVSFSDMLMGSYNAFKNNMSSKAGRNEMFMGMLIGSMGMPTMRRKAVDVEGDKDKTKLGVEFHGGVLNEYNNYKRKIKQSQEMVDKLNNTSFNDMFKRKVSSIVGFENASNRHIDAIANNDSWEEHDAYDDMFYEHMSPFVENGFQDMAQAKLDIMDELTDEEFADMVMEPDMAELAKQEPKKLKKIRENFMSASNNKMQDLRNANKIVERAGIEDPATRKMLKYYLYKSNNAGSEEASIDSQMDDIIKNNPDAAEQFNSYVNDVSQNELSQFDKVGEQEDAEKAFGINTDKQERFKGYIERLNTAKALESTEDRQKEFEKIFTEISNDLGQNNAVYAFQKILSLKKGKMSDQEFKDAKEQIAIDLKNAAKTAKPKREDDILNNIKDPEERQEMAELLQRKRTLGLMSTRATQLFNDIFADPDSATRERNIGAKDALIEDFRNKDMLNQITDLEDIEQAKSMFEEARKHLTDEVLADIDPDGEFLKAFEDFIKAAEAQVGLNEKFKTVAKALKDDEVIESVNTDTENYAETTEFIQEDSGSDVDANIEYLNTTNQQDIAVAINDENIDDFKEFIRTLRKNNPGFSFEHAKKKVQFSLVSGEGNLLTNPQLVGDSVIKFKDVYGKPQSKTLSSLTADELLLAKRQNAVNIKAELTVFNKDNESATFTSYAYMKATDAEGNPAKSLASQEALIQDFFNALQNESNTVEQDDVTILEVFKKPKRGEVKDVQLTNVLVDENGTSVTNDDSTINKIINELLVTVNKEGKFRYLSSTKKVGELSATSVSNYAKGKIFIMGTDAEGKVRPMKLNQMKLNNLKGYTELAAKLSYQILSGTEDVKAAKIEYESVTGHTDHGATTTQDLLNLLIHNYAGDNHNNIHHGFFMHKNRKVFTIRGKKFLIDNVNGDVMLIDITDSDKPSIKAKFTPALLQGLLEAADFRIPINFNKLNDTASAEKGSYKDVVFNRYLTTNFENQIEVKTDPDGNVIKPDFSKAGLTEHKIYSHNPRLQRTESQGKISDSNDALNIGIDAASMIDEFNNEESLRLIAKELGIRNLPFKESESPIKSFFNAGGFIIIGSNKDVNFQTVIMKDVEGGQEGVKIPTSISDYIEIHDISEVNGVEVAHVKIISSTVASEFGTKKGNVKYIKLSDIQSIAGWASFKNSKNRSKSYQVFTSQMNKLRDAQRNKLRETTVRFFHPDALKPNGNTEIRFRGEGKKDKATFTPTANDIKKYSSVMIALLEAYNKNRFYKGGQSNSANIVKTMLREIGEVDKINWDDYKKTSKSGTEYIEMTDIEVFKILSEHYIKPAVGDLNDYDTRFLAAYLTAAISSGETLRKRDLNQARLLKQAQEELDNGNYEEAIKLAEQVIKYYFADSRKAKAIIQKAQEAMSSGKTTTVKKSSAPGGAEGTASDEEVASLFTTQDSGDGTADSGTADSGTGMAGLERGDHTDLGKDLEQAGKLANQTSSSEGPKNPVKKPVTKPTEPTEPTESHSKALEYAEELTDLAFKDTYDSSKALNLANKIADQILSDNVKFSIERDDDMIFLIKLDNIEFIIHNVTSGSNTFDDIKKIIKGKLGIAKSTTSTAKPTTPTPPTTSHNTAIEYAEELAELATTLTADFSKAPNLASNMADQILSEGIDYRVDVDDGIVFSIKVGDVIVNMNSIWVGSKIFDKVRDIIKEKLKC